MYNESLPTGKDESDSGTLAPGQPASVAIDASVATSFLVRLFGQAPDDKFVLVWTLRQSADDKEKKASHFTPVASLDTIDTLIAKAAADANVYYGIGLQ